MPPGDSARGARDPSPERAPAASRGRPWFGLAACLWPILFFSSRIVPYRGTVRATGNDFVYLYYAYKAYLLDCLANGDFPLWSPSESAGFPFYANPFAQALYPPNAALLVFRLLAGGYSTYDHQLFTILGVSWFALGLHAWLRSLGLAAWPALFGAAVVSTSFRIAETMRFPNAVHAAAWYPWILLGITRLAGARTRGERVRWTLALAACATALLTAGYPYYVYYSLFLFGPYLLLVPRVLSTGGALRVRQRPWLASLAAAAAASLAVSSPYLVRMKQLLESSIRNVDDLRFALGYGSGWSDSVFSLFFPMAANLDGCHYVGTLGWLLAALYVGEAFGDRSAVGPGRRVVAALLLWMALVTYASWGEQSELFLLLWRWLPGFSRLRAWGRLSVVLLPVLAWLLALAFAHLQRRLSATPGEEPGLPRRRLLLVLVPAYALACAVQVGALRAGRVHRYYADWMPELVGQAHWTLIGGALAFALLGGLVALAARRWAAPRAPVLLALLLLVTAVDVWPVASRLWTYRGPVPSREPLDVPGVLWRSLGVPRHAGVGTISMTFAYDSPHVRLSPSFNVAVVPEVYFTRYWAFLDRHRREGAALDRLLGLRDGRRLLLSRRIDHPSVAAFLADADAFDGAVAARAYDGDRLDLDVRAGGPGYLTFVDNWDPDWRAYVDRRPAPISLAFGTFKSVPVPAGEHAVRFQYEPWSPRTGERGR